MTAVAEIKIVPGKCIGAGNCVEQAEKYFDQSDDDALVVVLEHFVPESDLRMVERAANVCPVAAILLQTSNSASEK
jgi:ferredoxin